MDLWDQNFRQFPHWMCVIGQTGTSLTSVFKTFNVLIWGYLNLGVSIISLKLYGSIHVIWRRKWQPTPVCLPRESHGDKSLVGYSPWGLKESDTTEGRQLLLLYIIRCHLLWVPTPYSFPSHCGLHHFICMFL